MGRLHIAEGEDSPALAPIRKPTCGFVIRATSVRIPDVLGKKPEEPLTGLLIRNEQRREPRCEVCERSGFFGHHDFSCHGVTFVGWASANSRAAVTSGLSSSVMSSSCRSGN